MILSILCGGLGMSKTKIVVIQLKEIVYTAIFVALGILLILLLVFMFTRKDNETSPVANHSNFNKEYVAGVYTSSIKLNDNVLNMEVVLDNDHINSIRLLNIDDSISTMYPLVEPSLLKIEEQLVNGVSLENIEYSDESKYTYMLLVKAIQSTLEKAQIK